MNQDTRTKVCRSLGYDGDPDELSEVFDEIDGVVALYRFNRSEMNSMPVRSERRRQLQEFEVALAIIRRKDAAVEQSFSGLREYDALQKNSASLQFLLQRMLAEEVKKGPDPDDRMWLIGKLAEIFCRVTGQKITQSYIPNNTSFQGAFSGRFFDFARAVLSESDFLDDALGGAIRDWQRQEKRHKKE